MFWFFWWMFPFIIFLTIPVVSLNLGPSLAADNWLLSILFAAIISLSLSLILEIITETFGITAGKLFSGRSANWNLKEQMSGPLNQVRFLKREGRFEKALDLLEEILIKAPDLSEALLLKAQILWEGFDNKAESKRVLSQVLKRTQKDDTYYRWAESLYRDLIKAT